MALISRRDALVGGAASLALPKLSPPKRTLRVAHMTDFHCQPELGAGRGSAMAVRHAMAQRPDLVLVGGDLVMDANAVSEARAREQWALYRAAIGQLGKVPVAHALGNHDPWGWKRTESGTTGEEPLWGKRWFLKETGQERTFRSFDQGAWHFVVLDNVDLVGEGYRGFVDDEQTAWLKADLVATHRPTLILSHIPLLSITPVAMTFDAKTRAWSFGNSLMTENSEALRTLFAQNRHVKISLSGHTHLLDRVDYDGVSYLCGGAVCGKWWAGPNGPFAPGYRMLDLHDDGTFAERYVEWGWHEGM